MSRKHEYGRVTFKVKEGLRSSEDEKPSVWLTMEPLNVDELPFLRDGLLVFELPEGMSIEEARRFASELSSKIKTVTYTRFSSTRPGA